MITKICLTCNKEYKNTNKKYCSFDCYLKNPNYKNPMKGKKRPDLSELNRKIKPEQVRRWFRDPKNKEKIIERNKQILKTRKARRHLYDFSGENNSNWQGGKSFDEYGYEFNKELKLAVKIRDNFKCKICGKKESELKKSLSIHHIDYDKKNNDMNNLVALCSSCHTKTNSKRAKWIEYFSREHNVKKVYYNWDDINAMCIKLSDFLSDKEISGLVPIPKGGIVPAVIISNILKVPLKEEIDCCDDVIIDEIVDFGMTFRNWKRKYPDNMFVCLHLNSKNFKFVKKPDYYVEEVKDYIVYPWEPKDKEMKRDNE